MTHCPKCDADISDSYESDDWSVGIIGGYYCDACDLPVSDDYEPQDDDVPISPPPRDPSQPLGAPVACRSPPQHSARHDVLPAAVAVRGDGCGGGICERDEAGMTISDERSEQAAAQCRAVAHMARALADLADARAKFIHPDLVEIVGRRSAAQMEALGDMLNGMDAVTEDDEWTEPVFEKAREFWPEKAMTP